MLCVLVGQSVAMFRRGKLICGCPPLFAFLLHFHVTVLNEAYAQTVTSESETPDALRTVSTFLENDTEATSPADLAQNGKTTPITNDDFMQAIEQNDSVWRDAAALGSILKAQTRRGNTPITDLTPSLESGTDDWSDIIADMEKHNDIICLYRKDTEAKNKKSANWQKLLKNMLPNYTVHLVLENGQKYVICLKRVNIPSSSALETSQTTIAPVEVSSVIITTPTQVTETSEAFSVTSVEAGTQPFTLQTETTSETTPATENFVQNITSSVAEDESSSKENEDCDEDNDDVNDKGINIGANDSKCSTTNSSEMDYVSESTTSQDKLRLERLGLAYLTSDNLGESDENIEASDASDCSEKSDGIERTGKPSLIIILIRQTLLSSETELPNFQNSIHSMAYMPQNLWLTAKKNIDQCKFVQNVRPSLQTRPSTLSNNPRFFNFERSNEQELGSNNMNSEHPVQISTMKFIPVKKSGALIYPREIQLPGVVLTKNGLDQAKSSFPNEKLPRFPRQDIFQEPTILPFDQKPLKLNPRVSILPFRAMNSVDRFPLVCTLIISPCKMNPARSRISSIPIGQYPMRKATIPIASVPLLRLKPTISAYRPTLSWKSIFQTGQMKPVLPQGLLKRFVGQEISRGPTVKLTRSRHPLLVLPRINSYLENSDEFLEVRENPLLSSAIGLVRQKKIFVPQLMRKIPITPFTSSRPVVQRIIQRPVIQKPFIPNLSMGLPLGQQMNPSFSTQEVPCNSKPMMPLSITMSFMSPSVSKYGRLLPYPVSLLRGLLHEKNIKYFASVNPRLNTNFPFRYEQRLMVAGLRKEDPAASKPCSFRCSHADPGQAKVLQNSRMPISPVSQLWILPDSYRTKSNLSPQTIIKENNGCRSCDTRKLPKSSSPELLNLANTNLMTRLFGQAINTLNKTNLGNMLRSSNYIPTMLGILVPKNFSETWQILGQQGLNNLDSQIPCKETIPLQIKIQGSTQQPIRVNVIPGLGENVTVIDAQKGLFSVEREQSKSLSGVLDNTRDLVKESSQLSEEDETKSVETRIDKIAAEVKNHVHKSLSSSSVKTTTDFDKEVEEIIAVKVEETTKFNNISEAFSMTETTGSVKNVTVEVDHTSKKP